MKRLIPYFNLPVFMPTQHGYVNQLWGKGTLQYVTAT